MTIPVNEPLMTGNELKYVTDCIETNWISSAGKYLERFETAWAEYCGQKHGIGVSNGTAALELAVEILAFPKGSEIIMPSFTIISCGQAIVKNGYVPVLVDCDPETYCMDTSQIESKITKRTVAIMPVHIYGHSCDMDPILDIASRYKLMVIEDAAEAHGGEYFSKKAKAWRRCGSFGHLSCFSFYANKIITTGEGGMVLTSDEKLAERLRKHRSLCFLKSPRFLHYHIGNNFRMTNIQAALGLAQLEYIDKTIKRKIDMAKKYSDLLKGLPLQLPTQRGWAKNVIWMYSVALKQFEKDCLKLSTKEYEKWPNYKIMDRLAEQGVQTRPFFIGMHEQPIFQGLGYFKDESYPVTERLARTGFYLPSGQAITDAQIDKTAAALKGLFQ
ncbi:MAG: DegT/DnrJ/EryC1/StrS family aminotransferase [Candidatus Omnitrophica bacterium]|nr:DegT/DnrJ/EryC1/StrS family aminotransferase [Candidatus Omnitrophota bacterium]MBU4590197.1 DegT/DnrJ/EryC1/StrS family aminotransferase [Candidatus Omnitrophota bacterium]